jgi:uncharacterized protein YkwD
MKNFWMIAILLIYSCAKNSENVTQASLAAPGPSANQDPLPFTGSIFNFKLSCEEAQFVVLLNLYRIQNNLNLVSVSKNGVIAARWHAQDMANQNYFSHTEPSGRSFSERAASFGYTAWAENIAAGNVRASDTFCQWKNSPGHNTNMLGAKHVTIGIGVGTGGLYGTYWQNSFGPAANDTLSSPLTEDSNCDFPRDIPVCN